MFIQDFRRIVGWGVGENNAAHQEEMRWLEKETAMAEQDGVRLLVVTQVSDLRPLSREPVVAWITHFSHATRPTGLPR